MDNNRNTREDINFSSNSDPINDKAADKEEIKKCPECGSKSLVRDYSKAEIFCADCGLVIAENIVDLRPKWRAFDSDQMSKRARVGAPMTYRIHDEKNLKQIEKSVNDWVRSNRVEKERNERYERVLKQYGDIISSITESDDLKKNLKKRVFSPPASLFLTSDVDECVEQIRGLLNNEWKDDFLRYFEKNYWKKEVDSNLKIQRGGAKPLTEGIMEDTVLLAFYYFLLEITIKSIREFGEIKKRETSLLLEWITMTAIIQTLFEKYKNILFPLIKRDSCYFLGKQAERDLIERNAHEWLGINMIRPWKIDPKFRCFDTEKLYALFEKIKEDETEPKRGRPSEGIIERQELAGMVIVSAQGLFDRVCYSIYKKAGSKIQKKAGLYGACFYVAAINKLIHDFRIIDPKVNMRFLQIYLQTCCFPVKSLKHWADFFNVSECTFRNRLNELKEFDSDLGDKIKAVEIFRSLRDKS